MRMMRARRLRPRINDLMNDDAIWGSFICLVGAMDRRFGETELVFFMLCMAELG